MKIIKAVNIIRQVKPRHITHSSFGTKLTGKAKLIIDRHAINKVSL